MFLPLPHCDFRCLYLFHLPQPLFQSLDIYDVLSSQHNTLLQSLRQVQKRRFTQRSKECAELWTKWKKTTCSTFKENEADTGVARPNW